MTLALGWALAYVFLALAEKALKRVFPQAGYKSLITVNLLTGALLAFSLHYFFPELVNDTFSEVFASGLESSSSDSKPKTDSEVSPYVVSVSNDLLGKANFDIRNITDTAMLGIAAKTITASLSHAPTVSGKAALAAATAASVGAVAVTLKYTNQTKDYVPSTKPFSRPPSPSNDNFTINNPNEELFSNLAMVFQSIQTLLVIVLVLFIFFIVLLWLKTKLDSVAIKDVCRFWNLREETAELYIGYIKNFMVKNLKFYLISSAVLILFDLSSALYFIQSMASFLSQFRF